MARERSGKEEEEEDDEDRPTSALRVTPRLCALCFSSDGAVVRYPDPPPPEDLLSEDESV